MKWFLGKSQVIAAVGLVSGAVASCVVQPYLEVFIRWNHAKMGHEMEMKPTERINRIAKSAFAKLQVPEKIASKVDFFFTNNAEAVALGSLRNADDVNFNDYAFIGLPYHCVYEEPNDIPLEDLNFATPLFPYSAYSVEGKRRLQLMCMSDGALEFLISREVVSLLGTRKLAEYGANVVKPKYLSSVLPSRLASQISCLSLLASLYLAYQVCYVLTHRVLTVAFPRYLRILGCTCVTALILLCQRQLIVAWRHSTALALDLTVAKAHHDLLVGGIDYYGWKRDWNAFWVRVLPHSRRAMAMLRMISRASLSTEPSPILRYQVQMALNDPTILNQGPEQYYFIPMSSNQLNGGSQQSELRLDDCSPAYLYNFRLPSHEVNSLMGDEKFASDGEVLRFNLAGLFSFGVLPAWLASIFQMLSFPTTCGMRKAALEALSSAPSR